MLKEKIATLSYSKFRDQFGLVVIEADATEQIVRVGLAVFWDRKKINSIPNKIISLYKKINWDSTYIDQKVGEHIIDELKNTIDIEVINTKKDLLDPEDIHKLEIMDMTEIVQFTYGLKLEHRIKFPEQPTKNMQELEKQVSMFTENKTEQGNITYHATGEEHDSLVRALLMCIFAARDYLTEKEYESIILQTIRPRDPYSNVRVPSEVEFEY